MKNFIAKLSNFQFPFFSREHIAFDFGTTTTRIGLHGKGVVLKEPTCLGLNRKMREFIFFGTEAYQITGKVPDFITIEHPIVNGIVSDFDGQVALISHFIRKSIAPYQTRFLTLKPQLEAVVNIPSIATEIEQKAVDEVLAKSSVFKSHLIESPIAAAVGCGFDPFAHKPLLIVDMGGGLVEIAVISGGGVVIQKTLKTAGNHMNKLIANYAYLKHGIILGEITCEQLKIDLFTFDEKEKTQVVRGKSLESGLPKSIKMRSSDIKEALLTVVNQIIDTVKEVIELSPPEVVDEIFNHGVYLTGGLANIERIDHYFASELKIETQIPDKPENTTIHGLLRLASDPESLRKLQIILP